jgi:hypothetical protein
MRHKVVQCRSHPIGLDAAAALSAFALLEIVRDLSDGFIRIVHDDPCVPSDVFADISGRPIRQFQLLDFAVVIPNRDLLLAAIDPGGDTFSVRKWILPAVDNEPLRGVINVLNAVLGLDDDLVGRFLFGFDGAFGRDRAGEAVDGWPLLGVCVL